MGMDFLRSKAKSFKKGWDKAVVDLVSRNLLTREAQTLTLTAVAREVGDNHLPQGSDVLVREDGGRLLVVVDATVRAEVVKPNAALLEELRNHGGYASGTIAAAHPTLNLLEVTLR